MITEDRDTPVQPGCALETELEDASRRDVAVVVAVGKT